MEPLKMFFEELYFLFISMAPYLVLGYIFAGLLRVFIPQKSIVKYMGNNSLRSLFNASFLGIPLPLCSCGVVPAGISLYKNGASKSSAISFLISTPQTGVDSMLVTYSFLGLPFALIRPVIAFFSGIAGGLANNVIERGNAEKDQVNEPESRQNRNTIEIIKEFFRYTFIDFPKDISKWLVIGLIVSAFISVIIPDGFFTTYIRNDFIGMLVILLVSVPFYVCATGSVPIAAVLIMKGLSPGAAFVFLMAGPATNAAGITLLSKVLGRKALIGYVTSIIVFALISGLVIDWFIPREWLLGSMLNGINLHVHDSLPFPIVALSSLTLIVITVYALFFSKINYNKPDVNTNVNAYTVNGMNCTNCKINVEESIRNIQGVESVNAVIKDSKVYVSGNADKEEIRKAVEDIGYKFYE